MLYKKNSEEKLSEELFRNPTSEYRSTPFWAWNTDLKMEELSRQLDVFKEMGFGGAHMHVRTGMSTPYLSDDFMSLIKGCTEKAKSEKMLAWLYDEDRWPSGAAGGIVTKDEQYRARCLLLTTEKCENKAADADSVDSCAEGGRKGNGYLLATYDVILDEKGYLAGYKKIGEDDEAEGTKWYVYLKVHSNSEWYNNQSYADTLSKKAIDRFIEVTHECYKRNVGDEFDKTIPAIFTDEPQFTRKKNLSSSFDKSDCLLPWTDDIPDTFMKAYGYDITDYLPELYWELPGGKISKTRYFYHDHICNRFTEAFADNIGKWCFENKIALTGHMMEEPSLRSQTCALGEAMRSYRSFGIPGIDILCASFEFTTAKQAQSAVHQYGREGMLSELYGVTGWDYDFRGYKLHGDWQACLGVTVRVPHLSWVAMGGEAKRDYPASISYQSPWWKEYSYLEDHFARVNTLMTRGKPVVHVGVIHPVESYWLHWGPDDLTKEIRDEKDRKFKNLTEWLIKGSIDFDFISESLLPDQCEEGTVPFKVGKMSYDVIIVPECESLRSTTSERLEQFRAKGGKLIFMGKAPSVCDGIESDRCRELYNSSVVIPYERDAVIEILNENRDISIRSADGSLTDGFIYQLRDDTDGKNLFISRCCEPECKHTVHENNITITIRGEYSPTEYNTITGEIYDIPCSYENGNTVIRKVLCDYDSLLLKLKPGKQETTAQNKPAPEKGSPVSIPDKVDYELSENNVLLIDMCEFALDDEKEFSPEEEILRLDNICRRRLGFRDRGGHVPQPWSVPREIIEHSLMLRYSFVSEIEYTGAQLALEKPEESKIIFNGETIPSVPTGWYTDKDIKTVSLPAIKKGTNTLTVRIPFGKTTNTEWMYILGNFGIRTEGHVSVITELPEKLGFGSITGQGFPFYGGNITYKFEVETGNNLRVAIPKYMGALTAVSVDGERKGRIVFPPYTLEITGVAPGKHNVDITLFGNRANCFGPVHRTVNNGWIGPGAWRTTDKEWSYDYCLKDIGIMEKPSIEVL